MAFHVSESTWWANKNFSAAEINYKIHKKELVIVDLFQEMGGICTSLMFDENWSRWWDL